MTRHTGCEAWQDRRGSSHRASLRRYLNERRPRRAVKSDLDIIGELCHFLEIGRIVIALSWKPVILAVPIQAWPTARVS
ncbi:hypothetical protein B0G75_1011171 [Paraburkholderia sp. BL18I3N2]|nr:hypothetical protein B0G75_1011171 [Paraburkholderia sp. BL18I3N2]